MIKTRAEINEIENRETTEKNQWNRAVKRSVELTNLQKDWQKKSEDTNFRIWNETRAITKDPACIKSVTKEYYKQLYTSTHLNLTV